MTFAEALEQMKKGAKAKLPHWRGYLTYEGAIKPHIRIHEDNGMDVTKTEMDYISNVYDCVASKDWVAIPGEAQEEAALFDFAEAIRIVKAGGKIARKGWNGKGQYVELATCISYENGDGEVVNAEHEAIGNKALAFVGTSGVQMGWLASQSDMLAEDWMFV